jgi:2-polyprenyl-3-methyl-5-hydroxy-6-metoxy-1,4-benzoquinol methylase
MDDIRNQLYKNYVSKFKTSQLEKDEKSIRKYRRWCNYKYLPALKYLNKNDSILELGCGPGYILEYLSQQGFNNVKGIDISQEQVDLAKSRNLNAEMVDVFKFLSGKKELYKAIIALDFIEHFTKQELLKLFPIIYDSLCKDGILLLQTPNGQGLFSGQVIYGDLTHITIFAQDSLINILQLTGFKDIHFSETGPAPDSLEGIIRTIIWKCFRTMIWFIREIEARNPAKLWTENMICWCKKE